MYKLMNIHVAEYYNTSRILLSFCKLYYIGIPSYTVCYVTEAYGWNVQMILKE